jgi:hypothetical protein
MTHPSAQPQDLDDEPVTGLSVPECCPAGAWILTVWNDQSKPDRDRTGALHALIDHQKQFHPDLVRLMP